MKKLLLIFAVLFSVCSFGQTVRISQLPTGTSAPAGNSILPITDGGITKKFTINQVFRGGVNGLPYYCDDSARYVLKVTPSGQPYKDTCDAGNGWGLSGNASTDPDINFIGTTDAQDLVIRTNDVEAMRVDANGNVGIGTAVPLHKLEVIGGLAPFYSSYMWQGQSSGEMAFGALFGGFGGVIYDSINETQRTFNIDGGSWSTTLTNANATNSLVVNTGYNNFNVRFGAYLLLVDTSGMVGINNGAPTAKLDVNGDVRIRGTDSVTIYALTPADGTFQYCTDCSGDGITGRLLGYIGSAWRRFLMD